MPPPFAGMDPFIEGQKWADFSARLICEMAAALTPSLRPRYCGSIEERVFQDGTRDRFIGIRLLDSRKLVTVIEVLSPSNKRRGSDGRREYLEKREALLNSEVHLLEVDLLRGGQRLPMGKELPPGDYFVILSRVDRRPFADVWPIDLRSALPVVPVPLANDDPDVALDLQACLEVVYDRAGYDYALKYEAALEPPLEGDELTWVRARLAR